MTGVGSMFKRPRTPAPPARWVRTPLPKTADRRRAARDPGTAVETLLTLIGEHPAEVLTNPAWQLAVVAEPSLLRELSDQELAACCRTSVIDPVLLGCASERARLGVRRARAVVEAIVQRADTSAELIEHLYGLRVETGGHRIEAFEATVALRRGNGTAASFVRPALVPEDAVPATLAAWRDGLWLERESLEQDRAHRTVARRILDRLCCIEFLDLRVVAGCVTSARVADRTLAAMHPKSKQGWLEDLSKDWHWVVRGAALEALHRRACASGAGPEPETSPMLPPWARASR